MRFLPVLLTVSLLYGTAKADDPSDKLLAAIFGGPQGIKAAGLDQLTPAQKSVLLKPYLRLLNDGRLAEGALKYLEEDGWKKYQCTVAIRGATSFLVVSDGLSTWATEAPFLFPSTASSCLGKGGFLGGPNEIITPDGKHHRLILADWKEIR